MIFTCCSENRQKLVKKHPTLNGISFIEVVDNPSIPESERQTLLLLHFIKPLGLSGLKVDNILITVGERITSIKVKKVFRATANPLPFPIPTLPSTTSANKVLCIKVEAPGDFSTYTLNLIKNTGNNIPPDGFDPVLSAIDFSFKVLCPNNFDCKPDNTCQPEEEPPTDINYLAKDYQSFRKLMLDRISLLSPEWKEKSPADIGITLVELLAYVGDHLSYRQDAVATEAYIGTARRRVSVKRHARLADYYMHDGSNARAWVQIKLKNGNQPVKLMPGTGKEKTKFISKLEDKPIVINYSSENYEEISPTSVQVFEPIHESTLYAEHNVIHFYTWGNNQCCLPKGATSATLTGKLPNLKIGDVLLFSEVKGPKTGAQEDADPAHRHPVRITGIKHRSDPLGALITTDAAGNGAVPLTEINWHEEDALPYPFCISSKNGTVDVENISVAYGNIVLADHGLTHEDNAPYNALFPSLVPKANPLHNPKDPNTANPFKETEIHNQPPRFRPLLTQGPISQVSSFNDFRNSPSNSKEVITSAKSVMNVATKDIKPEITLALEDDGEPWIPVRDLLYSNKGSKHFVVEVENNGNAYLRFGNNRYGASPLQGKRFSAVYRTGNGPKGNIGTEMLWHIMTNDPQIKNNPEIIERVWNPLAAFGGRDPETVEEVRQKVGQAFRKQERAVIATDFSNLAKASSSTIQRVATNYRWTGSWHTAFLTFDQYGGKKVNPRFKNELEERLNQYRIAGQDLQISPPQYVSLEMEMVVCIDDNYFISDVEKALHSRFNNGIMPNGQPALFHPDRFTFGQTLYLSTYYAAAQEVPGVKSVEISKFQRQGIDSNDAIDSGKLTVGSLEIPRLDNNLNFKENGIFKLKVLNR